MLARICHIPLWRKRLVKIVQGLTMTSAGINPKDKISVGAIRVTINNTTFSPIKTHTGVELNPR